jgi:hypothetical protein
MKTILAILLAAHGLLHLLGFSKAFSLAKAGAIRHDISPSLGVLWLAAAGLFVAAAALVLAAPRWWWAPALVALLVSQIVIVAAWSDARFGTLPNAVILAGVVVALLGLLPTSFGAVYRREVDAGLARATPQPPVTEADLAPLPQPVQRYLRYAGVVGRSRVQSARIALAGEMRPAPDAAWMPITAEQHSFFDRPERIFLMRASRSGVPFEALHLYAGDAATMRVKLASVVPVVDAKGPEMNRAETVTMFNDMCVLAPATLIDTHVQWEAIDAHTVGARFTNAGNTIAAVLSFDDAGALTSFASDDRLESADGKTFRSYRWTTPLRDYRDYHGTRLASHGEASWQHPEGEYVYARFDVIDVAYNVGPGDSSGDRPAPSVFATTPRAR